MPVTRNLGLLLFATLACIAPFWSGTIPPAADLPQHLAQIALLEQTLAGLRPELIVTHWYYPNTLVYFPLYLFWQMADPLTSGRLILSLLAICWVGASYLLATVQQRPIENWLLATPLTFNFLFSWGLLNFLIGFPCFCLFIAIARTRYRHHTIIATAIASLLLYYAHSLWFAVANAWLVLHYLNDRKSLQPSIFLAMLPAWMLALVWYPQLRASRATSGVETGIIWGKMPHERLSFDYLSDSLLGSLHAQIETAFVITLGLWILAILVTRIRDLERMTDKPLLLAALLLLIAYYALPATFLNTIFFNRRWLPCAAILLLLALPAPRIKTSYAVSIAAGFLVTFSVTTILRWQDWEKEQLTGFMTAIEQLTPQDRLLALNQMDGSLEVEGRPSLQLFAYAQALRGSDIYFSFTEHYSGAVLFRAATPPNPVRELVWSPGKIRPDHLSGFNRILISGDDQQHALLVKRLGLTPIGDGTGLWRLYRPSPVAPAPSESQARAKAR